MFPFSGLSVLDWIVLTIIVGSIISSFAKGFAREIIALASAIIGLILGSWFHAEVGKPFLAYVKTPDVASIIGFGLIFIGTMCVGLAVSLLVKKLLQVASLQWFDRILGAVFGFVRGWLIASIMFLILAAFPVELENVTHAKFGPYLLVSARVLVSITPFSLRHRFMDSYSKIQALWEKLPSGQSRQFSAGRPRLAKTDSLAAFHT